MMGVLLASNEPVMTGLTVGKEGVERVSQIYF